jgi:hypothetical protein
MGFRVFVFLFFVGSLHSNLQASEPCAKAVRTVATVLYQDQVWKRIVKRGDLPEERTAEGETLRTLVLAQVNTAPLEVHQNGHIKMSIILQGQPLTLHLHMKKPLVQVAPHFRMHDHVFHLHSFVLNGQIEDTDFELVPDPRGNFFLVKTESRGEAIDPSRPLSEYHADAQRYRLRQVHAGMIQSGLSYWLKNGVMHLSRPTTPIALTITERIFPEGSEGMRPRVIGPVGHESELVERMSFDRQKFDQVRARELISETLSQTTNPLIWRNFADWVLNRHQSDAP